MKRKRVKLRPDLQQSTPLFYRYIDSIKRSEASDQQYELQQSALYGSFSVIEAPSKLISGIIDYNALKK